jgi:diacylglycerol kinase family enzyme
MFSLHIPSSLIVVGLIWGSLSERLKEREGFPGLSEYHNFDIKGLPVAIRKNYKFRFRPKPSFMLINTKSGGNEGQRLLDLVHSHYPNIPAAPLAGLEGTDAEEKILALLRSVSTRSKRRKFLKRNVPVLGRVASKTGQHAPSMPHVRVVCAGGDGTASWCLSRLARFQQMLEFPDLPVALVMCPLGTGNDLAQSFGLGETFPDSVHDWLSDTLSDKADAVLFDTWTVKFEPDKNIRTKGKVSKCKAKEKHFKGRLEKDSTWPMLLYMSTGFDAQAVRRFRRSAGQLYNKVQHAVNGLRTLNMSHTSPKIRVEYKLCSGAACEKEPWISLEQYLESSSIAVLNTPSMMAGTNLWGEPNSTEVQMKKFTPAHMDDGKLEVVGSEGVLASALARFLDGVVSRLGQSEGLRMKWQTQQGGRPFQIDGEAIVCRGAGELQIRRGTSVPMILGPLKARAAKFPKAVKKPTRYFASSDFRSFA